MGSEESRVRGRLSKIEQAFDYPRLRFQEDLKYKNYIHKLMLSIKNVDPFFQKNSK